MKKLGVDRTGTPQIKTIKLDDIISRLIKIKKVNMNTIYGRKIKEKLRKVKKKLSPHPAYSVPFTMIEVEVALKKLRHKKRRVLKVYSGTSKTHRHGLSKIVDGILY